MFEFLKKNIFIIILSSITLFLGFLTFLTFIDRSFIELNQNNLQNLLIVNILLLLSLFVLIFLEIKKSIRNDYDYVVNLGGHVNHKDKIKTYKSHFIGVKNLIDIFTNSDLKGFVQIGSGGEYGKLKSPHIERKSGNPKSTYYKSKLLSTNLIIKKLSIYLH